MRNIKLSREEWKYNPNEPLGPEGGFGAVFSGAGRNNNPVAVKRIKLEANRYAHRELSIADELVGRKFHHVIPTYDSGQDVESNSYFVVMAKADYSLQEYIEQNGALDDKNASSVLLEIANGLSEVSQIVHRDLKPQNVLFHEDKWKIADFGIARFVEKATSNRTLKNCLTYSYAAPEQWRFGRSSNATDIYALGCIGYFLLSREPPFSGPSQEDFQAQHLYKEPPRLDGHNPNLMSLLYTMLRKEPKTRPNVVRVIKILQKIIASKLNPLGKEFESLAIAGEKVAQNEAENEAKSNLEQSKLVQREILEKEALKILHDIINDLFENILVHAPTAKRFKNKDVSLGSASIYNLLPLS